MNLDVCKRFNFTEALNILFASKLLTLRALLGLCQQQVPTSITAQSRLLSVWLFLLLSRVLRPKSVHIKSDGIPVGPNWESGIGCGVRQCVCL